MYAVSQRNEQAGAQCDLSRTGHTWLWLLASAVCIAVCALPTYAALRQSSLNADMLQSFLAAQSLLKRNVFLSGWHLARDNFVFDETLPLAVVEAIFGRHVSVLTGFSVSIYALLMTAWIAGSVRFRNSFRANLISLATIVFLAATIGPVIDLPMLHPGYHGMGIVISLVSLMLLAALAREDWQHRRLTASGFAVLSIAAIGSDPLTVLFAFGPALVVLAYDMLAAKSVLMAARLFLLVLACIVAGECGPPLMAWLGGFRTEMTVSLNFVAWSSLSHGFQGVLLGFLQMTGANIFGKDASSLGGLLSALRLAGWLCGMFAVASWLFTPQENVRGLLDRILLTGAAVMIAACLTSDMFERAVSTTLDDGVGEGSRYLSPLVALGVALLARIMPGTVNRLATGRLRLAATGTLVVAAAIIVVASLVMASSLLQRPSWAAANIYRDVGQYLRGHGLTCGVAGYWDASPVTALSKGRVTVRAVSGGGRGPLLPFLSLSNDRWYPQMAHPMFAIWHTGQSKWFNVNADTVGATYGKPTRIENMFGFSIAYLAGSTCEKAKPVW